MTTPSGQSGFSVDSPAAAIRVLTQGVRVIGTEVVPLEQAGGRVLAEAVRTDRPSPAVDVSSMDGFAVRMADLSHGRLMIAGEVRIGREPPAQPLGAGGVPACVRIVTGGGVPAWADAVVKREDVREEGAYIVVDAAAVQRVKAGEFIRRCGENAAAGAEVVAAGTLITPAVIGAMAAVGHARVSVHKRLRVRVICTGDEVLGIDATPTPWHLRDSNGPAVSALLRLRSWVGEVEVVHVPDEQDVLDRALADGLARADALVLTGGVSAGHRDHVPAALARAGVQTLVHGVPQRPGRPMLGGVTADGRPVLGLPGNPVSVLVTARRMGTAVLAQRAGLTAEPSQPVVRVENPDDQRLKLWWHRPVRMSGAGKATLLDTRGSGDLIAAARSDGFVEMPPGEGGPGPWAYYSWTDQ